MYTMPFKHQAFSRAVDVAMAEAPPLESARARGAGGGGGGADSQAPSGISGSQERVRFLHILNAYPFPIVSTISTPSASASISEI
jgi:hypothetical protein